MAERELLFVYGTLRRQGGAPGGVNRLLGQDARALEEGTIGARLYRAGGYPAAVPDDEAEVRGELYELEEPEKVLPVLDRYEGRTPDGEGLYRRERVEVERASGGSVEAWVYFYNRDPSGLEEIESGDYLAYLEARSGSAGAGPEAESG